MKFLLIVCLAVVLFGCSSEPETKKEKPLSVQPVNKTLDAEVKAMKLNVPWQINVRDENVFYLSNRSGEIISIKGESKQKQSLKLEKPVVANTESGLLGFLILDEPDEAIVYHTYKEKGELMNRVVRVQKQDSVWREKSVLIEQIPGGPIHNGGRIAIGPDGLLYITTGDAGTKDAAQDQKNLAGKILRMNVDGTIPFNNPFAGSPVYSYGHRNPQGIDWTTDGTMYSSEHGSSGHDEINKIIPGGNYGWPVIQGDETKEGMISPVFHSGENTWAPSGIAISDKKIFVACLAGQQIREFDLQNETQRKWKDGFGRIRDVKIKDGVLFAVTNNTDGRGKPTEDDDQLLQFTFN